MWGSAYGGPPRGPAGHLAGSSLFGRELASPPLVLAPTSCVSAQDPGQLPPLGGLERSWTQASYPPWGSGPVPARGPRPATPLVWGGLDRSLHALSALGDAGPRPATPPRGGTGTARPPPSPEGARPCPATPSWELGRSLSALSAPAATLDPPSDPHCGDWPDGPRRRWRGSPPQGPAQLVRRVSGFTPLAQPLYGHT